MAGLLIPRILIAQAKDIEMVTRSLIRLLSVIFVVTNVVAAQSVPPKKDIPAIAKAANAAIVTIVMADNDKPIAQGTGFLVNADGAIVTNYHVIATGNVAVVRFPDGTILPVDGVLATDKFRDLAIIKIHGKTFPTLTLGNSDQIQVGEEVVTIGNPLGLELTVSNGILSGIRSDGKAEDKLLQITAPISHGSSGGPLFNMFGEVIGVNAMFLNGGENLNFAIPVNDAKNLLQSQSAELQRLPNEPDTATPKSDPAKTDVSTELRPDVASPREKESGIVTPSHKAAKGDHERSYYIRAYQQGSIILEYDGRQLAAVCREALSWIGGDSTDRLGAPIATHDCVYLTDQVGQHIPEGQMWRQDKELRFEPFGQSKADVADVLDIVAEAPIGSPLRRPSPKTSPEILKTLHWVQNTLADGEGKTYFRNDERENLLWDVNGCQVTFEYVTYSDWPRIVSSHSRQRVSLGDLDPTSLNVTDGIENEDIVGHVSDVTVHTTDKVPRVHLTLNDWSWEGSRTLPTTDLLWQLPAPYAARFAKALKHAITLCGGKPSSF